MEPILIASDPVGTHRVLDPPGVLPQAAHRLDARREIWDDEVRIRVERINLDAASFHQLTAKHGGDGDAVRSEVLAIVGERGKMHNPVTGSGGMLIGTVEAVGPASRLGFTVGERVATLVSLTLTPLVIEDALDRWDGRSEQVPADGYAILFGRSIAARLPADLSPDLALAVMDVCGAPALTRRVVDEYAEPVVAIIGASGKSGSLSAAAARHAGAARVVGVVPNEAEATRLGAAAITDSVVVADARDPLALRDAVESTGDLADVTVVCVDVPGCEQGALLATAPGGTVIFFSMATSFTAAALGAEGVAADVTMLIGNGYVPGHAEYAVDLIRQEAGVRGLFDRRTG